MRQAVSIAVTVLWGLWFGATVALFVFVASLFAFDRQLPPSQQGIAAEAAPQLFITYARYQLLIAAAALIGVFVWRLIRPCRAVTWLFALLGGATVAGAAFSIHLLPTAERLRAEGAAQTPEFRRLHGQSMAVLGAQTALLLLAGAVIPLAVVSVDRTRFVGLTAAPKPKAANPDDHVLPDVASQLPAGDADAPTKPPDGST
jgi:hypothetical protein